MHLLVLTGDLHVNSTVALCPPKVELDDGGVYHASDKQLWIYERWVEFWNLAERLQREHKCKVTTVINGELADDNYHSTTQLISKHTGDMAKASLLLLEPVAEFSDELIVTRGSEAHSGRNASLDNALARSLGATRDSQGQHARWLYRGVVEGVRLDVAHHPGTGHARPWTKGADANRLAQMVMARYVQREMLPPHLAIRGHNHKPSDSYDNHPTRAIILPSWQLDTSFGHRLGGDFLPIGGMLLLVEDARIVLEHKHIVDWPFTDWSDL